MEMVISFGHVHVSSGCFSRKSRFAKPLTLDRGGWLPCLEWRCWLLALCGSAMGSPWTADTDEVLESPLGAHPCNPGEHWFFDPDVEEMAGPECPKTRPKQDGKKSSIVTPRQVFVQSGLVFLFLLRCRCSPTLLLGPPRSQ